ncbi:phosphodiester glycosidase family protein [Planktothrix sp. FACHB-1355]|uniref:Phosphodiester glycosidase family protein n=2 Tax=Oscillatoriophycideae TaxID=1301283 RepID=A0A926VGN2_9CYAN|nr:phosphodiester glycosidase family protein [Aerosakkonema funiforme]MBD2183437.1 phosphodiester glycosidase family protein [Aerosakkonema funiforme FACHB-1375]MBD3557618.1 phosphodiester glycosidase family protein [Planktothrix sp. FACHB-1355]
MQTFFTINLKQQIFISLFFAYLCSNNILSASEQISTPSVIPPGFDAVKTTKGVTLYQKNTEYVQIVDLSKGASVKLLNGDITNAGKKQGAYGGDDPQMQRQTLNQAWLNLNSSNPNAFCITNGQFFSTNSQPATNLAFPVKVNGKVISDGYAGESEYPTEKLMLEINSDRADITTFNGRSSLYSSAAPNLIVGLHENADKSINKEVGRTFVGVKDRDSNGTYETVLIFNSTAATQAHATETLRSFGADKVIMLDGGGSTQLICEGESYITSPRTIPQMLGVVSAPKPH